MISSLDEKRLRALDRLDRHGLVEELIRQFALGWRARGGGQTDDPRDKAPSGRLWSVYSLLYSPPWKPTDAELQHVLETSPRHAFADECLFGILREWLPDDAEGPSAAPNLERQ